MPDPDHVLFYVHDPVASAALYARLLGHAAIEVSPTFALFITGAGLKLGLWARAGVEPAPTAEAGAGELGFAVPVAAEVDATHQTWSGYGLRSLQAPVDLDFGRTCVLLDPDGNRLRVLALAPPPG